MQCLSSVTGMPVVKVCNASVLIKLVSHAYGKFRIWVGTRSGKYHLKGAGTHSSMYHRIGVGTHSGMYHRIGVGTHSGSYHHSPFRLQPVSVTARFGYSPFWSLPVSVTAARFGYGCPFRLRLTVSHVTLYIIVLSIMHRYHCCRRYKVCVAMRQ